jgi:hypothetical protein
MNVFQKKSIEDENYKLTNSLFLPFGGEVVRVGSIYNHLYGMKHVPFSQINNHPK